jgi:hypothetical protein
MNKVLLVATIAVFLFPVVAFSQGVGDIAPGLLQMTILPQSVASKIDCCVAPSNKVFVSTKTEVFWDNKSGSDVKLTFGKGTDCKQIPGQSPGPYEIGSLPMCYVVPNLAKGKTLSLRFIDGGQYNYTIEFLGTDRKPEGGAISVF